MNSMTDEELVALTQGGDVAAFNRLAQRWERSVYSFARRLLGNADDAGDVCQEALVKAYQNIERLREGAKFKSWLHHIAYNLCRDRFRTAEARQVIHSYEDWDQDEEAAQMTRAGDSATEANAQAASLRGALHAALRKLPDEQRRSILLREYHGFTSEEIAEMTGVPAATVRTRIFYGLKSMKKQLRDRGLSIRDFD